MVYRGSEEDKLWRWKQACEMYDVDFFVTADGDDLFCEPELIDLCFSQYKKTKADFIRWENCEIGAGFFTYGISYQSLKKVCEEKKQSNTEYMWPLFEKCEVRAEFPLINEVYY
jgi:spore coat polysaccharide biosynthesis protein SpsF